MSCFHSGIMACSLLLQLRLLPWRELSKLQHTKLV